MITTLFLFNTNCLAKQDLSFNIGVNLGMPSFVNLSLGCTYGNIDCRISGMYSDEKNNGLKLNLGYKVADIDNTRHIFGIAAGRSQDSFCDWSFMGPVYIFNDRAFYLELGVAKVLEVRKGDFSNLPYFPIIQAGYNYQITTK